MINSFDIFDTLIAREVKNPKDIFIIMENVLKIENFANNRIKSTYKWISLLQNCNIEFNFKLWQCVGIPMQLFNFEHTGWPL